MTMEVRLEDRGCDQEVESRIGGLSLITRRFQVMELYSLKTRHNDPGRSTTETPATTWPRSPGLQLRI